MLKTNLIRNPLIRNEFNINANDSIPDLAYEISEQSLENINGGSTPVCASIAVSLIGLSYVTNIVTAANSVKPNDDPKKMPDLPQ